MPVESIAAAGTMMRSTSLMAIGPSSSPAASGVPCMPRVSVSSSPTVQSSRPSSRVTGNSTRMPRASAQFTNGRVFGSDGIER